MTRLPPLVLQDLSISQTGDLNLRAGGGSCLVDILFSPHQRLPAFTAELQAQCAGVSYPLLTLQGSCPVQLTVFLNVDVWMVLGSQLGSGL